MSTSRPGDRSRRPVKSASMNSTPSRARRGGCRRPCPRSPRPLQFAIAGEGEEDGDGSPAPRERHGLAGLGCADGLGQVVLGVGDGVLVCHDSLQDGHLYGHLTPARAVTVRCRCPTSSRYRRTCARRARTAGARRGRPTGWSARGCVVQTNARRTRCGALHGRAPTDRARPGRSGRRRPSPARSCRGEPGRDHVACASTGCARRPGSRSALPRPRRRRAALRP